MPNKNDKKIKEEIIAEKKEEKVLLIYGRFCKSMDSLRHYDSLQSANEGKVSNANWYAVAAAGFLFHIAKNSLLTSLICMAIGLADIMYISACCITSLMNVERFFICFFYELLKIEAKEKWVPPVYHYMFIKEEKTENHRKQNFSHHGSAYLKAIYYIIHLSIPFIVLIFTPGYVFLRRTEFYLKLNLLLKSLFRENRFVESPFLIILYILFCASIFIGFSLVLLKIIGPMKIWLEKIYKMDKKSA